MLVDMLGFYPLADFELLTFIFYLL